MRGFPSCSDFLKGRRDPGADMIRKARGIKESQAGELPSTAKAIANQ